MALNAYIKKVWKKLGKIAPAGLGKGVVICLRSLG